MFVLIRLAIMKTAIKDGAKGMAVNNRIKMVGAVGGQVLQVMEMEAITSSLAWEVKRPVERTEPIGSYRLFIQSTPFLPLQGRKGC